MGMQDDTATLENNLVVSYQDKWTLSIYPFNSTPLYLPKPKRNENLCSHSKWFYHQKCKINFMFFSRWINRLWHIGTMQYYLVMKRNKPLIHTTTWRSLKGMMLSERSQTQKGYILYNSICMSFWNIPIWIGNISGVARAWSAR